MKDDTSNEIIKSTVTSEQGHESIGTFELLKYPQFTFAALSGTLGYFLYGFMEPILAFRVKEFELS